MRQDHIDIVKNFFSLIEQRDIDGLVDLFDEDCVVYEPFSKENGLQKNNLKPFFQVLVNTNNDITREVSFLDKDNQFNEIETLVTFNKDGMLRAKFIFNIKHYSDDFGIELNKIETLHIDFI